jgi:hypothetical protein
MRMNLAGCHGTPGSEQGKFRFNLMWQPGYCFVVKRREPLAKARNSEPTPRRSVGFSPAHMALMECKTNLHSAFEEF